MKQILYAAAFIAALCAPAYAQEQPTSVQLLCHDQEAAEIMGTLLEGGLPGELLAQAAVDMELMGRCIFTPLPVPYKPVEKLSTAELEKLEVWTVVPTADTNKGAVWYVLRTQGKGA